MFNPSGFKRYFSNTAWLMLERVIRLGLALIISILLARHLGPERFGVLQYAISFVGLFSLISTLGLDSIVVKELVKRPEDTAVLLGTAFILKLFGTLLMLCALVSALLIVPVRDDELVLILIIALGVIPHLFKVIDYYFQAIVQVKYNSYSYVVASAGGFLLILLGITLHAPLGYFAAQMLWESLLAAAGLWLFYHHQKGSIKYWRIDRRLASSLLKESWPLLFSLALVSVYINTDKIMIRHLLGEEETGIYSVAAKLSEGWYFIPTVIVSSLFPAIIKARQNNPDHYHKRMQNLYDLMVWLGISVAIPMTFISDWLVIFLYGHAYSEASHALIIHIWAGVIIFLGVASGKWYIVEGHTIVYFIRVLLGLSVNIGLNFIFIPAYGIAGAAWSIVCAQLVSVFLVDALYPPARTSFRLKCQAVIPIHLLR